MNTSEKIDRLLKLHVKIGKRSVEVGKMLDVCVNGVFLPPDSEPRFDVVFVGVNPSTTGQKPNNEDKLGNWNSSETDELFQKYLVDFDLCGCYATDFSHFGRAESKTDKISKEELEKVHNLFEEEIGIIQPKIIVCFGKNSFDLVSKFIKSQIEIMQFWHPGAAKQGHGIDKLKQNWNENFKKLKEKLLE